MGLRLVDVFRSVLEELATGRGHVLVEPMDPAGVARTTGPDDQAPPALSLVPEGLALVPAWARRRHGFPPTGLSAAGLMPGARSADRTMRLKNNGFLICSKSMRNPHRTTKGSFSKTSGMTPGFLGNGLRASRAKFLYFRGPGDTRCPSGTSGGPALGLSGLMPASSGWRRGARASQAGGPVRWHCPRMHRRPAGARGH